MLLDNYAATLYPNLKFTTTDGTTIYSDYTYAILGSTSSEDYSESGTHQYYNMFRRGIAFGSGTTPPRKQIIS